MLCIENESIIKRGLRNWNHTIDLEVSASASDLKLVAIYYIMYAANDFDSP